MNAADELAYPNGINNYYCCCYYLFTSVIIFRGGVHPREYKSIIFWIMLVGYDFIIFVRNYKVYLTGIARRLQSTRFQ